MYMITVLPLSQRKGSTNVGCELKVVFAPGPAVGCGSRSHGSPHSADAYDSCGGLGSHLRRSQCARARCKLLIESSVAHAMHFPLLNIKK